MFSAVFAIDYMSSPRRLIFSCKNMVDFSVRTAACKTFGARTDEIS